MKIVPRGTRKLVFAQLDQSFETGFDTQSEDALAKEIEKEVDFLGKNTKSEIPTENQNIPSGNTLEEDVAQDLSEDDFSTKDSMDEIYDPTTAKDLTDYIKGILVQEFSYPPRVLNKYESDMVEEKMFPDERKEVTITLPDRNRETLEKISDDKIKEILNEIQERFGLFFNGWDKKDKKITIKLTSDNPNASLIEEQENEEPSDDLLDSVYGNQSKKSSTRTNSTIIPRENYNLNDKLKEARENYFLSLLADALTEQNGDINDS
jgi:hypothetical protein